MTAPIQGMLTAQSHTLRLPKNLHGDIHRYVQAHQSGTSVEYAPFRRQLDLWALAIATACAKQMPPLERPSSEWGEKFVDTRAVQIPDGLCALLAVLAFVEFGPEDSRVDDPAQIIELGNRYAGAGVEAILGWIRDPDLRVTLVDKLLEHVRIVRNEVQDRLA